MISYETLEHSNVIEGGTSQECIITQDNYGMEIVIYSIFEHVPAHAHVQDSEYRDVAIFLITDEAPKSCVDVIGINAEVPTHIKGR